MAEHGMANGHPNEPDFIWWVRKVLKKRDRLLHKDKSRCQKNRFKCGVEVPLRVEYYLSIYR